MAVPFGAIPLRNLWSVLRSVLRSLGLGDDYIALRILSFVLGLTLTVRPKAPWNSKLTAPAEPRVPPRAVG